MTHSERVLLLLDLPLLCLLFLTSCQQYGAIKIPTEYKLLEDLKQPPVITEQSTANYTVFPTDDIILKCEGKGVPAPEFRWTKDRKLFDPASDPRATMNATSGTVVIATSANGVSIRQYQGTYRCYASNEYGTAISTEINLVTESTPKWPKESVRHFNKEAGESLVLQCNPPTSMASSMIIWMTSKLFNIQLSERVSQGRNGNLYFSNLEVKDSLEDYTCYAQIPGTRTIIQKEPIALHVAPSNSVRYRKPRLMYPTGHSSSKLALRSRPLYLECIAEGFPTPSVHWHRLDGDLPWDRVSYDNFNKTLRLRDVIEDDDGEYRCTVRNGQGQVQHTYHVSVEAAPYWVRKPEDGVYGPGENVRLDCDVDAKPEARIRWRVNGVLLSEVDRSPSRTESGNVLILSDVQKADTAIYQCEAENKHGRLLVNVIVQVIELPAQILTPSDMEYRVVEKQTANLHCKAFGAPTPTVFWSKEGVEAVLQDHRYFLNTSGMLRINATRKADAGIFTCNASNTVGADIITATLTVKNASQIIEPPTDQHIQRLHPVMFRCLVRVDPSLYPPSLHWEKDGNAIDESDDDQSKYHIWEDHLKIKQVEFEDEGSYTCIAKTTLDTVRARAQLIVVDAPEPPFDVEWSPLSDLEVRLVWSPGHDHNSPIEEFIVEFEEDIFHPGTWHSLARVSGDQQEAVLRLSPFVNYSFRVIAVNQFGASAPSQSTGRYKTPSAAPEKNPEGVKGEGTTPNNMVISWEELSELDWNGPEIEYIVKWRQLTEGREWKELVVESSPYTVNSTPTFAPYQIQVQASNQFGVGPKPRTVIGYSGEDYPLVNPDRVTVVNESSSSVRVTWSPVPADSLRGHLRGYNVSYWKQGIRERQHQTVHGNHTHTIVRGLVPYTDYNLQVTVFNGKGQPNVTQAPYLFTTQEGVPSPPVTLRLELRKDTEVTASWGRPHHPNGILRGYLLQYQQINGTESGPLREVNISSPSPSASPTSLTVPGLLPYAIYRFQVMGRTAAGHGRAATREIFTSREGEPRVVKNITYTVGDTHTNLSWIGLVGHRVTELHVQYTTKDGPVEWRDSKPVNSSQNFFMLDGLQPGTPYRVKVLQLGHFKNLTVWERDIETIGPAFSEISNGIVTQGWFIGLISAVILLILILLIVCFIKRNKGGKYSVKDKEDAHVDSEARPMKDETFGEYRSLESDNDPEEKPFEGSQPSLDEQIKPLGSDDSLVEYGGSVDMRFNEDGSFIGQYSGQKEEREGQGPDSSTGHSPVNVDITLD